MRLRTAAAVLLAATAATVAALAPFTHGAAATGSSEGVPHVDHVVILVLENESFATTWSPSSPAHYLNGLVAQGAFVPNYYGTGHVSLDNYVAMTSGLAGPQIASTYTDCLGINLWACVQEVSAASALSGSVADQVESAGLSWKQYADGTTQPCVHADYSPTAPGQDPFQGNGNAANTAGAGPDYADRHVPFLYYSNVIGSSARCDAHLRPYTELSHDLASNALPSYSFITPDTCHDGHDSPCSGGQPGGLTSADAFLAANLPQLIAYLRAHDGVLFVTFDEGSASDPSGCCAGGPGGATGFGGQVGMVVLGAPVAHTTTQSKYDHASLLRTTEDMLGITTYLNNAASASPITGIWAPPQVASKSTSAACGGAAGTTPGASALPDTSGAGSAATPALLAAAALGAAVPLARRVRRRRKG